MACACPSYKLFLAGEYGAKNNKCWLMSTLAPLELEQQQPQLQIDYRPNTKMYLMTGRLAFCVHQYQVVAKLADTRNTKQNTRNAIGAGGLVLRLQGDAGAHRCRSMKAEMVPRNRTGRAHYTALLSLDSRMATLEDEILATSNVDTKHMSNYWPWNRVRASARYCPNSRNGKTLVRCS